MIVQRADSRSDPDRPGEMKRQISEQHDLEQQYATQPGDLPLALLLIDSYARHQQTDAIDEVVMG